MAAGEMHADEVEVGPALALRLLESQFPQWAALPLTHVRSDGTDNAIYRLGEDLALRLPRYPGAARQAEKEARWLPQLAPSLPLPVPTPVALGEPDGDYPWHWSVCRWLPGEAATLDRIDDAREAAAALAAFVTALQRLDPEDGPPPGDHNFGRGAPLATRDDYVREALAQLHGIVEVETATSAWEAAVGVPAWDGPPVWIHGDLHGGNLLADGGRLSGVIDFGGLGVGDPACDLMVAWTFLPPGARAGFRAALAFDDAAWIRARGWALSMGLIALPYYRTTNPALAANARRWVDEVLSDELWRDDR